MPGLTFRYMCPPSMMRSAAPRQHDYYTYTHAQIYVHRHIILIPLHHLSRSTDGSTTHSPPISTVKRVQSISPTSHTPHRPAECLCAHCKQVSARGTIFETHLPTGSSLPSCRHFVLTTYCTARTLLLSQTVVADFCVSLLPNRTITALL